jgi:outer membrane protein assembly factor BamE
MRKATIAHRRQHAAGPRPLHRAAAAAALCLALAGCSWLEPHKIDVQQGNIVDRAARDELRTGMTRKQVRFLLGNPVVSDPFHADRWDYIYYVTQAGQSPYPTPKRLSLFFEGDVLTRVLDEYFDRDDAAQATDGES